MAAGPMCAACGLQAGVYHVSVRVDVFGPAGARQTKLVQLWLCEDCQRNCTAVLRRDGGERERVARRITQDPPVHRWQEMRS